jgi:hypothetical protein
MFCCKLYLFVVKLSGVERGLFTTLNPVSGCWVMYFLSFGLTIKSIGPIYLPIFSELQKSLFVIEKSTFGKAIVKFLRISICI